MSSTSKNTDKRQVPSQLKALLQYDVYLTDKLCSTCENSLSMRSLRSHYKMLELSCHGVPWFAGWLILIWCTNTPSLHQMQVNLYLGLILDIFIVAVTKSVTRRRRPEKNVSDMFVTIGPDVLSFPSGHATRAVFIATFFIYLFPVNQWFHLPLLAWSFSVCLSRVLLRRHHLLDVGAGIVIGIAETWLISLLWLDQETTSSLVSYFGDSNASEL